MTAPIQWALAVLALGLALAPFTASAQERERRCYFGECPDDDSPQVAPPERPSDPPVDQGDDPDVYSSEAADLPHYCCTIMGPLGPYPNPGPYGPAPVGSVCTGVAADGLLYQGSSCYGNEQPSAATMPTAPSYCCTAAGRFGPFPNPGWPEGSACWSDTAFGPMQGAACY
jgi:hypothetical protein